MKSIGKNISSQLWRSPAQPAMEFARIEYQNFHFEPHFHDHYVLLLVEKGVNLGQRCREKYEIPSGEMLLIQPGEMHTGSSFEGKMLRYLAFYPEQASVERWLEKLEFFPESISNFNLKYRNLALSRSFRRLFGAVSATVHEPLEIETALLDFFETLLICQSDLTRRQPEPVADSQKFKKAQAFIRDNFSESFSLDELASAAGASPFHLVRLFRKHSGLTPFDFLRSFRVEQAKALMRTCESLTEVAYRAGFYDQSHFVRSFKNHTGFLPSYFRKRIEHFLT
jgi:AraC-like DNA-binding protein